MEPAARRIVEIASTVEPVQDGRLHVELINGPFLFKGQGKPRRVRQGHGARHRARLADDA